MPRPIWRSVSVATVLLALAACSHADNAPPPSMAAAPPPAESPPPPPPAPVSADQQFVDAASASGMAEVDLGKLAREKAGRRDVKAFAARMVRDHTAAGARLAALAQKLNLQPSTPPDSGAQQMHDQLAALSGKEFDKPYMDGQVQAHQDTIQAFEAEVQNGQDPQLKRFAQRTLPTLRMHLREAQGIDKRVGG